MSLCCPLTDLWWAFWVCFTMLVSSAVYSPRKLIQVSGEPSTPCHTQEKSENFIYSGIGGTETRTSTSTLFALKENIPLTCPPSTCSSCAMVLSFRDVHIKGRVQHRGRSRGTRETGWKNHPNTSYQLSPIPCFCEDLWYLKAAARLFEETFFSLKRSWTPCCPFFVSGWHYLSSTAEWQQHFEKWILKGENCKYLSEHNLFCLPEREGVYMKNEECDNTHSQAQWSSHSSSAVSRSTSSSCLQWD